MTGDNHIFSIWMVTHGWAHSCLTSADWTMDGHLSMRLLPLFHVGWLATWWILTAMYKHEAMHLCWPPSAADNGTACTDYIFTSGWGVAFHTPF